MRQLDDDGLFDTLPILPSAPLGDGEPLEVLHDREYRVRAYRRSDDVLTIHGAVRDQKPPGLYIAVDPHPLTLHHMQIELDVAFPSMEIVDARVAIATHPSAECPSIVDHYGKLVGLSIARGFTQQVRDLFGGPRGCTHTTALLQAMGPVAIQSVWSMRSSQTQRTTVDADVSPPADESQMWRMNLNTCHVWAEDGDTVARLRSGGGMDGLPLPAEERLVELGIKPDDWSQRMRR